MTSIQKPPSGPEGPGDWNRYIRNNGDLRWLIPYEKHLASVIRKGLFRDHTFRDTILLLKQVVPYFVTNQLNVKLWLPILMDALIQAQNLKDNRLQIEVLGFLGESHIHTGRPDSALRVFMQALERANEERFPETLVAIYIGLFKMQWFDLRNPKTDEYVQDALSVAHEVDDLDLKANLHHELARAYIRMANMPNALAHAQTSYNYWQKLQNEIGIGRAAFTLAVVYRYSAFMEKMPDYLDTAEHFLNVAKERITPDEYAGQYTVLAYETGVLHLQRGNGQEALDWLGIALSKAVVLDVPHYIAISHHGIGLAQTHLRNYPEAREHLQTAIEMWKKMENSAEESSALQALGYLEGQAGHKQLARDYLNRALGVCETLSETPQRETLWKHIMDSIDELEP